MRTELPDPQRKGACACKTKCGDVAERDDHPLAVCKGLPLPPKEPLVEIVLVRRDCAAGLSDAYDYEADIARGSNIRKPGERLWEASRRLRRERGLDG